MKAKKLRSLATLFLGAMLFLHVLVAWSVRERVVLGHPDFTIFYTSGKLLQRGLGHQLYNDSTQLQVQKEFAPEVSNRRGVLPYNHPAFEALWFVPIAGLSYVPAYWVWAGINLVLLTGFFLVLRSSVTLLRGAPIILWFLAALAFYPVAINLLLGQDMLPLLLLFALAYISLKNNSDAMAGCWLALGLFRFHLVLPVVAILVLQRRYRILTGFLPVGAALVAISVAIVGWESALSYPNYLLQLEKDMVTRQIIVISCMPNLRGLFHFFETFPLTAWMSSGIVILVLSVLLCVAVIAFTRSSTLETKFSTAILVTILVSFHTNIHELSLLILPMLLLLNSIPEESRIDWQLLGTLITLFLTPLYLVLFQDQLLALFAVPVLVLLWVMLSTGNQNRLRTTASMGR